MSEIQEEEILTPAPVAPGQTPIQTPAPGYVPKKREEMVGVGDLDGAGKTYIDFKVGQTVELITKKLEKVEDDKYCLSNSQNADGKAYKVEITDQDDQILSITAWDLWNKIRFAFKDLNALAPVTLKLMHPAHSSYEVDYLKDGKYVRVVLPAKKA